MMVGLFRFRGLVFLVANWLPSSSKGQPWGAAIYATAVILRGWLGQRGVIFRWRCQLKNRSLPS